MNYKHTQRGYLILFVLLAIVLLFGFILTKAEFQTLTLIIMFVVIFILVSFLSLNVIVDEKHLQIKFGYGIYKKRFMLSEINSAKTVKNHWYYGWGIRLWLWPRMVIFNVSGFDAVEITMKDGEIFRIGTDEPKKLEQVILQYRNIN